MEQDEIDRLAAVMVSKLFRSESFRDWVKRMIREITLRVLIEQENTQVLGAVRAFINACDAKDIRCRVNDEGQLMVSNTERMTADLKAVLTVYREPIMKHLERIRDSQRREQERKNGQVESLPPITPKGATK